MPWFRYVLCNSATIWRSDAPEAASGWVKVADVDLNASPWVTPSTSDYIRIEDPYIYQDSNGNWHLLCHRCVCNALTRARDGIERLGRGQERKSTRHQRHVSRCGVVMAILALFFCYSFCLLLLVLLTQLNLAPLAGQIRLPGRLPCQPQPIRTRARIWSRFQHRPQRMVRVLVRRDVYHPATCCCCTPGVPF